MAAKHWLGGLVLSLALAAGPAQSLPHLGDHQYYQLASLEALRGFQAQQGSRDFTVLDKDEYQRTVRTSRTRVNQILSQLKPYRGLSLDDQTALIISSLLDKPYLPANGMGEGDWQPKSRTYRPGAPHIKQHPVYRLDAFDCQTFVQVTMALLYANTLDEFDQTLLAIAYGAAGNPAGNIVRYYNRNHFVDADFNPINQRHGWLEDATAQGALASLAKTQAVTITRNAWFAKQLANLEDNVQVLSDAHGDAMAERFITHYRHLPFPKFDQQTINLRYLPKSQLIHQTIDGRLVPNQALFDRLPTPAIVENVRDVNQWKIFGKKIKDLIGSELSISHMGILYRQTFKKGDVIHFKTVCDGQTGRTTCQVTPIVCRKSVCQELMIAHATDNFPKHFLWYQPPNGSYACSSTKPTTGTPYTTCDRVISQPLFDYLTDKQFGDYWMTMPSFLGIHVEKLLNKNHSLHSKTA